MVEQLPAIIVLLPLLAALAVTLLGLASPRLAAPITVGAIALTLLATIRLLGRLLERGGDSITYYLGGWDNPVPIGIRLEVDFLNAPVLILVAGVALLAVLYSLQRVPEEHPGKAPPFYALVLLLITGLLGITISADAFNVFVLLEVSSLTSYALIALGPSSRAKIASFHYVIIGTIGASFYLLGVGYLYAQTGSLNMGDIRSLIEAKVAQGETATGMKSLRVAFILIMLGLWIKMAFSPLHGWIANAYSYAPSTSGALLAPLVTKVAVYLMIRMITGVFGVSYAFGALDWSSVVVWLAVLAILAGSILALAQRELKRMLCYLIVAEVGYMVGGVWLGNENGMTGAIFHILADALMTSCLFLAAGLFWRRTQDHRIESLHLLLREMPLTSVAFIVGALSMIGIPPTCGFFSKWYLIAGGIEAGHWGYVAALLISSLINAILFFRIIEILFLGKKPPEGHGPAEAGERRPAPPVSLSTGLSLGAAALGLILLGLFNVPVIEVIGEAVRSSLSTGMPDLP